VGGGALRTASLAAWLSRRYEVDVIGFTEGPEPAQPAEVHDLKPILLPTHRKTFAARAIRNLDRCRRGVPPLIDRFSGFEGEIATALAGREYELSVIEHFWCAAYLPLLARHAAKVVLNLHNIESLWHERCARTEPWPVAALHRRFRTASLALERRLLPRFHCILVTSEEDGRLATSIAPGSRVIIYPNGIPFHPLPDSPKRFEVVFSGVLDYEPNRSAIRYFLHTVWPRLRRSHPGLRWRIVGRNPEAVASLVAGRPDIECTGAVDDAVRLMAESQVAVVPVLAGSGTRVKILEMWAAGLPVVSTTLGAEGLGARAGEHLLLADDPAAFAEAVSSLLASAESRLRLGKAGRARYEEHFSWPAIWRQMDLAGTFLLPASQAR
jgi:glycosyltransferase involved in cell wall biosynthesis